MMKKISALFLALALVFSLTACTGGTPDGSAQPSGSAPAAEGKFTPAPMRVRPRASAVPSRLP